MNQKARGTERFPGPGNVDDLDAVVEKDGNFRRTAFAVCWNQRHSTLRTVAGLVECELVAG